MIEKTIYIADDGTQFNFEDDCLAYEQRQLYTKAANLNNDLFCFDMENKRYFPTTYQDFENLKSFFCKTQEAYEILQQVEDKADARFLPFEGDSYQPHDYDEKTVPVLNAHWVYDNDEWTCLEQEAKKISDAILEQQNLIEVAKQSTGWES